MPFHTERGGIVAQYCAAVRLLHLADFGNPHPGSFIPVLVRLMRTARDRGWSVEAAFSPSASGRPWLDELDAAGITWRIAPDVRRRNLRGWVRGLLEESSTPTILHTHFTRFDVPAALAAKGRSDTHVIWHLHSPLAGSLPIRMRNRVKFRALGRGVAAIVCVAPGIREQVLRRGAASGKVLVLPNAIDTDRFPVATDDGRRQARATLGLPTEEPILLHLGWDWHRKGGDIFLDAVAAVRRSMGDSPLLGVTIGDKTDERAHLPEGVVNLAPTPDVQALYAAADVLVSPSRAEGQPYAVLEALSCGTPVVASDIPGHSLIADGISDCRIVPADDSSPVAAAIEELLSRDASTARAEATAAHQAIVDRFGVGAWSDKLLDCYRQLFGSPKS